MTLEEMEAERRKAKADCKKAKKDSANPRMQFLETLDPKVCAKIKRKEEVRKLGRVAHLHWQTPIQECNQGRTQWSEHL